MADLDQVEIVLDLSRLMSRMLHAMPTGVDRVEMAYARTLLRRHPGTLSFAAINFFGVYGRLDRKAVLRFLDETEYRWNCGGSPGRFKLRWGAVKHSWRLRPKYVPSLKPGGRRVLVQSSPAYLHKPEKIRAKLRRERASFICLVHDLIPIEFPEYARPGGASLHRLRMRTIAEQANGILVNSQSTAMSLTNFAGAENLRGQIRVAHLGIEFHPPRWDDSKDDLPSQDRPYFVTVGTIEPRKNHLLLLHIWRRMLAEYGTQATPRLMIVGRRGWENENIVDMLDRCQSFADVVIECSEISDSSMVRLLQNSRALLLPSFAEGFGLPVIEAFHAGVPVICSDLPTLREVGGVVPDYLDPLDGPGWIAKIRKYMTDGNGDRERQLGRIKLWSPATWDEHIDVVLQMVKELAQ